MRETLMQQVHFHEDLVAVLDLDGQRFVAIKPICTNIGLDWDSQQKLIKRDERLNAVKVIMTSTGTDKKSYDMLCLPLRYIPLWLAKLNPGRYTGATRNRLLRYQEECADVLYRHFLGRIPPIRRIERPRGTRRLPAGRTLETSGVWLMIPHVAFLEGRTFRTIERRILRGNYPPNVLREVPSFAGRFPTRKEIHFSALSPMAQERYWLAVTGQLPEEETTIDKGKNNRDGSIESEGH